MDKIKIFPQILGYKTSKLKSIYIKDFFEKITKLWFFSFIWHKSCYVEQDSFQDHLRISDRIIYPNSKV